MDLREEIREAYEEALRKNRDTFREGAGIAADTEKRVLEDPAAGGMVAGCFFQARSADSICRELEGKCTDIRDVKAAFAKEKIPVFDIYFIAGDQYAGTPDELFLAVYGALCRGPYRLTVTGWSWDHGEFCYILTDRYRHRYRLYVRSEAEHQRCLEECSGGREHACQAVSDRAGVTVLDLAFAQGEEIGLHLETAYVNGSPLPAGLDTLLDKGDRVRLEYDLSGPETAAFEWFGFVKTDFAKETLIAYFNRRFRG